MDFKIGEIRFSNAMITTRNSLMPGSFGQIAYRETWSGTGGSPTPIYGGTARGGGERRWLSYNHIGNVVNTSHLEGEANDAGALVESIDTDAYGNPLTNALTGAWGSSLSERGLTTKELDPAAGMYYFYQRWYDPTTATFASRAPYPPMMEHGWGYVVNNPTMIVDVDGELWHYTIPAAIVNCGVSFFAYREMSRCIAACERAQETLNRNRDKLPEDFVNQMECENRTCAQDCVLNMSTQLGVNSMMCVVGLIGTCKWAATPRD